MLLPPHRDKLVAWEGDGARMKQKMVWRYWCDFCGKGGCGKGAMRKHERHCTANPGRECRGCRSLCIYRPTPLADLVELAKTAEDAADVLKAAKGCPVCVLAAIRQAGRDITETHLPFEFEAEMKLAWDKQLREDTPC